jgi:hypothetical protein
MTAHFAKTESRTDRGHTTHLGLGVQVMLCKVTIVHRESARRENQAYPIVAVLAGPGAVGGLCTEYRGSTGREHNFPRSGWVRNEEPCSGTRSAFIQAPRCHARRPGE